MMKVAVLMSTYNGERFLQQQLDSLLSQQGVDLTLFVRDDGSSDATVSILQNAVAVHPGIRLTLGANIGVISSFLTLIDMAGDQFDYYALCDQDDYWHSQKLQAAVRILQQKQQNQPLLYCSALEYVGPDLSHLGWSRSPLSPSFGNALVENIVTGCTTVFNGRLRDLLIEHQPCKAVMHDWWMYLLASAFGEVVFDPQSYIKYRQHGANVVGATPGFFPLWKRRFFYVLNRATIQSSIQVAEFYQCFGNRLNPDRQALIKHFIARKDSFASRRWLLRTAALAKQTVFETMAIKMLILLGWY